MFYLMFWLGHVTNFIVNKFYHVELQATDSKRRNGWMFLDV